MGVLVTGGKRYQVHDSLGVAPMAWSIQCTRERLELLGSIIKLVIDMAICGYTYFETHPFGSLMIIGHWIGIFIGDKSLFLMVI